MLDLLALTLGGVADQRQAPHDQAVGDRAIAACCRSAYPIRRWTRPPLPELRGLACFSDLTHFSRHFRRAYSETPSDYRRQAQAR